MSYVVLARKYRPRSFEEMVGQDHVVRALTHALEQGRLHHAYLFTGTRGIGKTTVSRILAKSLNCTGPDGQGGITARPCGMCTACREIDADRYIDYIELDAASNRSIDEIRELIERAAYKPTVGRFKVFMIDEAHQLTKDAFNALLKTLEEPPEYLKFVLATTDPERMLPTVLSRCLQFNLRPMAPQTVAEHLERVLRAESVPVDPGALYLLSRAARGSMRDALSLTDQAIAFGGGQLLEPAVRSMLGAVDRRHAQRLIQGLAARDGAAIVAQIEGLRALGLSAAGTLEECARLLQQMAVYQVVPAALDANDPEAAVVPELAPLLAPDETQLLYSMVLHGRAELGLAPDEYSGLVMVLLRFLAFPPAGGAVLQPAPPMNAAASPTPMPAPAPAPMPAPAPVRTPMPAPSEPSQRQESLGATQTVPTREPEMQAAVRPAEPPAAGSASIPAPPPLRRTHPQPLPAPETAAADSRSGRRPAPPHEGPPSWMDEAPFEGEAVVRPSGGRAPRAPDPEPEPAAGATEPLAPADQASPLSGHVAEQPAPTSPMVGPTVHRTEMGDRWAALVATLQQEGAVSALVRELAIQAELMAVDATSKPAIWRLRVDRDTLRNPALAEKLQAAILTSLGEPVRLQVEHGEPQDSPARRDAEHAALRQLAAETAIHSDPLVRALLDEVPSARIVPGTIRPL